MSEKNVDTEHLRTSDAGIEEQDRRRRGAYYTPKLWVDHAHKLITNTLGDDWREKYVVVDPACGTKNLTRDYEFSELYSMTIDQDELDSSSDLNPEGTSFQYDFLNDDVFAMHGQPAPKLSGGKSEKSKLANIQRAIDWINSKPHPGDIMRMSDNGELKMDAGLLKALREQKPIVILSNPPYKSSRDGKTGGKSTTGITKTAMGQMMDGYDMAKQNMYTQFLYRYMLLANDFGYLNDFHLFTFSPVGHFTSPSFEKFRNKFYDTFSFDRDASFIMHSKEFGLSGEFPIGFTHNEVKPDRFIGGMRPMGSTKLEDLPLSVDLD